MIVLAVAVGSFKLAASICAATALNIDTTAGVSFPCGYQPSVTPGRDSQLLVLGNVDCRNRVWNVRKCKVKLVSSDSGASNSKIALSTDCTYC